VKFRGLLVGGAVVLSAAAMASAATIASAATPTHTASTASAASSHVLNIAVPANTSKQNVFEHVMQPLGSKAASVTVGQSCREPNCNMGYHGGFIQAHPQVWLFFWGTRWKSSQYNGAREMLINMYRGLGTRSDQWSTTLGQYKGRNGHPSFSGPVLKNWYYDFAKVPATITPGDLSGLANSIAHAKHLRGTNIQIVIAAEHGACFSDGFAGSCGRIHSNGRYCAWHSATNTGAAGGISFTNLPYQLDAGSLCGEHFNGSPALSGFSIVGGHEYAESISDPYPITSRSLAWIDLTDHVSGGEVADKCAWGGRPWGGRDPIGWYKLSSGKFYMQSLWSNQRHECKM
jgi:hypothetical protein